MEPSGLYWYSLYERLKRCGFSVCLVNCLAVKNNRRTMSEGTSKTDPKDRHRMDAFEIKALAADLADAVETAQMWLDQAIALVEHRDDYQLLLTTPKIDKPTAAAILTAVGDIDGYCCGKQLVKLAGLDIRRHGSGTSIKKRPRVAHIGSAYLRHWLYHYALRLVAHEPHLKKLYRRKKAA